MEPLGQKLQQARLAKKIIARGSVARDQDSCCTHPGNRGGRFLEFSQPRLREGLSSHLRKVPRCRCHAVSRRLCNFAGGECRWLFLPAGRRPAPRRRRSCGDSPAKRPALLPFIIAVGVLVLGLYMVKLLLNIQRITPSRPVPGAVASVTPLPSASPTENIVAPRALPVESAPASEALVTVTPAPTPEAAAPCRDRARSPPGRAGSSRRLVAPNVPTPPLANRVQITPDAQNLSARDSGRPDRSRPSMAGSILRTRRRPFGDGT